MAVAAAILFTAPVIGDGVNRSPEPATPRIALTVPATQAQAAAAGITDAAAVSAATGLQPRKPGARVSVQPITIRSRITSSWISTEENHGSYVGIRCPAGSKAISGGVISNYINLLLSSSSPNRPTTGKYTPGTWWVSVTNTNIDGNGGTLAWRGVVNCLSPVRLGSAAVSKP